NPFGVILTFHCCSVGRGINNAWGKYVASDHCSLDLLRNKISKIDDQALTQSIGHRRFRLFRLQGWSCAYKKEASFIGFFHHRKKILDHVVGAEKVELYHF